MYRLIASDLDETLLDSSHRIPDRVRAAIRAARELGARFVPATGRPFNSVDDTLADLELLGAPGEYVLSFNGGVIIENSNASSPLTSCELSPATAGALYEEGVRRGLCMHLYTLEHVYLYNYLPIERSYIEGRMNIVETHERTLDFLREAGEKTVKLLFMSTSMDELRATERELADLGLTDGLDVVYSSNRYLEFNAPGVNKGSGLLELARRLGISPEETMAIGDSSNDIPMIRAAGLGVAVANATDEAKAAADYVCAADNNAGGVAEAIERFVLGA
ncbi:Cof-type HAD-IIB family hydrolase [Thermophilibacter provencensis]|uniref:Cof-type HAD-IIB family hydrolase n=1 Tax=Thermophilibacter provencensis TaxID=1852386 RepID=A0ABT7V3D6_9ACTN|nr:Cof-type HAD-IIB family hydrolase [Thermophilibacter provencensis]MDM8271108.1 Cof-type HAD-IIB family hydrolase [Thermophilibacter provencensis]